MEEMLVRVRKNADLVMGAVGRGNTSGSLEYILVLLDAMSEELAAQGLSQIHRQVNLSLEEIEASIQDPDYSILHAVGANISNRMQNVKDSIDALS